MRDVFAARKVSKALELSLELARTVLRIAEDGDVTDDTFRRLLLDAPEQILERVQSIDAVRVSEQMHEQLCRVMEDAEYDPATAARESESGLLLNLDHGVQKLRRALEAEHMRNQRLLPTASFLVGVDGSRQSYMAFEVASRLCRQGTLAVLHVTEAASPSLQLPLISTDFILQEYKAHCTRLELPVNRVAISSEASSTSVAGHLIERGATSGADFIVVGAIGKGGPAVDQVAHVPRELLLLLAQSKRKSERSSCQVLVVPPAPANSMRSRESVFVVALDRSGARAAQCLNAALKLARSTDTVRVVHFYTKPVVGAYDEEPFETHRDVLTACNVNGAVDVLPLGVGVTIAESVQDYVATWNASYLIIGCNGERAHTDRESIEREAVHLQQPQRMGRVAKALLFSPRCAMCVCV